MKYILVIACFALLLTAFGQVNRSRLLNILLPENTRPLTPHQAQSIERIMDDTLGRIGSVCDAFEAVYWRPGDMPQGPRGIRVAIMQQIQRRGWVYTVMHQDNNYLWFSTITDRLAVYEGVYFESRRGYNLGICRTRTLR
jgi:hypothetical protein